MSKLSARVVLGSSVIAALIVGCFNYATLQYPLKLITNADPRNEGISVVAHYKYFINPNVIVFDLRTVSGTSSPMDVTRMLLQFADRQKNRQFATVELSFRGNKKFMLSGEYFRKLGQEYGTQNPVYTLRTLPENLQKIDGTRAYGEWTGGLIGVLARQMEDFTSWHRAWYIDDIANDRKEGADHAK